MKISVVIPAYQAAETILPTLASCQNQSPRPYEIIVVLDGATDNTASLIRTHFPQVTIVSLEKNQGPSMARNVGAEKAQGDWIAFLDADDQWHPKKLEILSQYLQDYPKIKFWINDFADNKENLSTPEGLDPPPMQLLSLKQLLIKNRAQGSCITVRKDQFLGFDATMRYCEDHDLAVRSAWHTAIGFIALPLTYLGRPMSTRGGLSGEHWKMRLGELKMYRKLYRLHPLFLLLSPALFFFSLAKALRKKLLGT